MTDYRRILAVDPGTVRIGLALSDDMLWTARPLEVRKVKGVDSDVAYLVTKAKELDVREVIIGVPYRLDGSESRSTQKAKAFGAALKVGLAPTGIPLTEHDEALTTWEADEQLKAKGLGPQERRKVIDAHAAAVLLQEVLDQRGTGTGSG